MRLATWNVNSLKARMARVEEWLDYAHPDVLCLQETKMADAAFPAMAFAAHGYEVAHHGDGRWNGVAIASRIGLKDVVEGFGGLAPAVGGALADEVAAERRLLAATCGGVRVVSVYVPNGRSLDNEQYGAKLEWLGTAGALAGAHRRRLSFPSLVCGDFNIAPQDKDVYDPGKFVGTTHTSPEERAALRPSRGVGAAGRLPPGLQRGRSLLLVGLPRR